MFLPEKLQQRSFVEWNYLVRGLMEVWEMARLLGFEQALEEALRADSEAVLAEKLGRLGNECAPLAGALHLCKQALALDAELPDRAIVKPQESSRVAPSALQEALAVALFQDMLAHAVQVVGTAAGIMEQSQPHLLPLGRALALAHA